MFSKTSIRVSFDRYPTRDLSRSRPIKLYSQSILAYSCNIRDKPASMRSARQPSHMFTHTLPIERKEKVRRLWDCDMLPNCLPRFSRLRRMIA